MARQKAGTRRPKHILIDGVEYEVVYANKAVPSNTAGHIDYNTRTIVIRDDLGEDEITSTLIHEVMHGVMPYLNEDTIVMVEEAIVDVLVKRGLLSKGK